MDPVQTPPRGQRRSRPRRRWHVAAAHLGWALTAAGALVLVFLAFQLWGTSLLERRAQRELAAELDRAIEAHRESLDSRPAPIAAERSLDGKPGATEPPLADVGEPRVVRIPARPSPESGSAVARIRASTIGLDKTVVEGVGRVQLGSGPGRYPVSALPGHPGHVVIAGHRTTYGSPFAHLDELEPGDPIVLETIDGIFTYWVEAQFGEAGEVGGHRIVSPDDIGVIADRGDNRLTLTSCHPRYSDRQRLVVTALLEGTPVAFAEPD